MWYLLLLPTQIANEGTSFSALGQEPNPSPVPARVSFAWAVIACASMLAWQFLTVHYNRDGNWTALFCTGQVRAVPPALQAGTYIFPGSIGYDGQMYRYVAHDPILQSGLERYVDYPPLRYSRILVPGLAFLLAGGHQQWIDGAYIAITALFVLLGSYWLSRWAVLHGFHAAWALAFLLVPATLISMDRMTEDGALAALSVGFAYYVGTRNTAKLYLILVLACLVRETGALLMAGCIIFDVLEKQFFRSAIWATACLPALGWYSFLYRNLAQAAMPPILKLRLGTGIVGRILSPPHYNLSATLEILTRSLDVVALVAIICALIAGIILLRTRPLSPISIAVFLFVVLALMLTGRRYWLDSYGYSRVLSPLLALIALQAMASKPTTKAWWWILLPTPLVDLRIGLQLGQQVSGILRGLLGG